MELLQGCSIEKGDTLECSPTITVASEGLAWDPLLQIVISLVVTGILEDPKPVKCPCPHLLREHADRRRQMLQENDRSRI